MSYRDVLLKLIPPGATTGVEVGVHRGRTSELLLKRFRNLKLWLVDPWGEWQCSLHSDSEENQELYLAETRTRVQPFGDRSVFVRKLSVEAVSDVPDGLDFAFIDAEHDCESVKADIAAWWPKCGRLMCHDYGKREWGVTQAVQEFAAEHGLGVNVEAGNIAWMEH